MSLSSTANPRAWPWWGLAAFWAALIFWLSSSPDAQGGVSFLDLFPYADKVAHGTAFGILGALVYRASGHVWLALVLASIYGVSDEIHQAFVPGRSADVQDWLADTVGAAFAVALVRYLTRHTGARSKPLN